MKRNRIIWRWLLKWKMRYLYLYFSLWLHSGLMCLQLQLSWHFGVQMVAESTQGTTKSLYKVGRHTELSPDSWCISSWFLSQVIWGSGMPWTWHSNIAELLVFTVWSMSCRSRAGASWATRQNNTSVLHSCNLGGLIILPASPLLMLETAMAVLSSHLFTDLIYCSSLCSMSAEYSCYSAGDVCDGQQIPNAELNRFTQFHYQPRWFIKSTTFLWKHQKKQTTRSKLPIISRTPL